MAQEKLPLNHAFIIREDMVEKFLNHKANKEKLKEILEKAKRAEKRVGIRE